MNKKEELHDFVLESITIALIQLLQSHTLKDITVSQLCRKAGVSRISFYRNFRSMEDILKQYLTKCLHTWWEDFSKLDRETFYKTFLQELMNQYRAQKDFIDLLYKNKVSYIIKDHIFDMCDPNPQRDDFDSYTRAVVAGSLFGLVDEWIRRGMKNLPEGFHLDHLNVTIIQEKTS